MGRPAKDIDADQVRKLAKLCCTQEEIADFFDCAHSVISERFRQEFHVGRGESKISLRRMQWTAARGGSVPMLIHLGKVYLGQSDKLDVTSKGGRTVVYIEKANNPRDEVSDAELDGWAEQYVRAKADRLERERKLEASARNSTDGGFGDAPDCLIVLPPKRVETDDEPVQ